MPKTEPRPTVSTSSTSEDDVLFFLIVACVVLLVIILTVAVVRCLSNHFKTTHEREQNITLAPASRRQRRRDGSRCSSGGRMRNSHRQVRSQLSQTEPSREEDVEANRCTGHPNMVEELKSVGYFQATMATSSPSAEQILPFYDHPPPYPSSPPPNDLRPPPYSNYVDSSRELPSELTSDPDNLRHVL